MTVRIPRWLIGVLCALLAAGAGAALGIWATDGTKTLTVIQPEVRETVSTTTVTDTTTRTVETTPVAVLVGLPGGQVIQDLINQGVIDTAQPVTPPKAGWDSEFQLDRGGVRIRFRDTPSRREAEWSYLSTDAGEAVDAALVQIAEQRGYTILE